MSCCNPVPCVPTCFNEPENFGITYPSLVGAQGPQGPQGNDVGSQGPQGDQGVDGPQGDQGSQGPQGNDGAQGSQGNQGDQGPGVGTQGPQGSQGAQGAGVGAQGAQGDPGAQGAAGAQGSAGAQGAQGTASPDQIPVTGQISSYTLQLTDAETWVQMNVATPNTLTVPANVTVAFIVGTQIIIEQIGAGLTSFAPVDGSVTINSRGAALKSAGQFATAVLTKTATNVWNLSGDITT